MPHNDQRMGGVAILVARAAGETPTPPGLCTIFNEALHWQPLTTAENSERAAVEVKLAT